MGEWRTVEVRQEVMIPVARRWWEIVLCRPPRMAPFVFHLSAQVKAAPDVEVVIGLVSAEAEGVGNG